LRATGRIRRSRRLRLAASAALVALSVLLAFAPAAAAQAPSVELLGPDRPRSATPYRGRVGLDLGVLVASTGGDFRLHVNRPVYWLPPVATQVDAGTGALLRTLPSQALSGFRGLGGFLVVSARTPGGKLVARRRLDFCPNTYDRQRVNDSGPQLPHYPFGCGSSSPFVQGMVWGIEPGWSVGILGEGEESSWFDGSIGLRPGRYAVTFAIAPLFRSLLEVPEERAKATVTLTVRKPRLRRGAPRLARASTGRLAVEAAGDVPVVADPDPGTLPDLAALPAWGMELRHWNGREQLSFASSPWNAGPAPLVVEGFRREGEEVMDAFQYFHDEAGAVVGKAPAGTFDWDPRRGHNHWHFLQFIRYSIVDARSEEVVRSKKQSFCLAPTDAIDLTVPRAAVSPWSSGLGSMCGGAGARWVREVLPAGWADTYYQSVAGQAFDVTSLPNGRYRVFTEVNPLGLLEERWYVNNVAVREIELRGKPGRRYVVQHDWLGVAD
jgi:hypothetical protein